MQTVIQILSILAAIGIAFAVWLIGTAASSSVPIGVRMIACLWLVIGAVVMLIVAFKTVESKPSASQWWGTVTTSYGIYVDKDAQKIDVIDGPRIIQYTSPKAKE